jgi:hypothetical protein
VLTVVGMALHVQHGCPRAMCLNVLGKIIVCERDRTLCLAMADKKWPCLKSLNVAYPNLPMAVM